MRWVQSAGSNKALEFLNAGSLDFGSTAGAAALIGKINGNPIQSIYVYSRPEWTALVTKGDSPIKSVADLKGKRVAVTRGTDPHIFLVARWPRTSSRRRTSSSCCCSTPMGGLRWSAATWTPGRASTRSWPQPRSRAARKLFYRKPEANSWGVLNVREEVAKANPEIVKRVLKVYEDARANTRSPTRPS